jgi:hypothetical protein
VYVVALDVPEKRFVWDDFHRRKLRGDVDRFLPQFFRTENVAILSATHELESEACRPVGNPIGSRISLVKVYRLSSARRG